MSILRVLLGRPAGWRPSFALPRPSVAMVGPLLLIASLAVGWLAFADAKGKGNVPLGLWVGSVAILLMAWSFVLAVRPTLLEPIFGGLDSMYRVHRWAGALAIAFMWLHTSIEPEIKGGVAGAAKDIAGDAKDLAELAQKIFYLLAALSVIRLMPYRWWRLTHKLMGIPFAIVCWHFYTVSKPYANGSAWGWWFGTWMILGLVAYVLRVIGIDMIGRGRRYTVVAADHYGTTTRLELAPAARPIGQRLGQFAFVKLDAAGMREPHPFTIASAPDEPNLEFMIRHLGDWSERLGDQDLVGSSVRIEGPYGRFAPFGHRDQPVVWIAGGVGCTPFLAAAASEHDPARVVPTMLYAARSTDDNPMLERLRNAHDAGRVRLELFTPETGRMRANDLTRLFPDGLAGHHVALCGPGGLVGDMSHAARQLGATSVETEDFDLRQGVGPSRLSEFSDALRAR